MLLKRRLRGCQVIPHEVNYLTPGLLVMASRDRDNAPHSHSLQLFLEWRPAQMAEFIEDPARHLVSFSGGIADRLEAIQQKSKVDFETRSQAVPGLLRIDLEYF